MLETRLQSRVTLWSYRQPKASQLWSALNRVVHVLSVLMITGLIRVTDAADIRTDSIVATIPIPGSAESVVADPTQDFVYVGSFFLPEVVAVSTRTRAIAYTIPTNHIIDALAISPDGRTLYVADDLGDMEFISIPKRLVRETLPIGGTGGFISAGVAASPDGTFLYVANGAAPGSVSVFANGGFNQISVGGNPEMIVFTPDSKFAYVTTNGGFVAVINTATQGVQNIPLPATHFGTWLAIDSFGQEVYVVNGVNTITDVGTKIDVISTATNSVTSTLTIKRPTSVGGVGIPALTADAEYLYVPVTYDNMGDVSQYVVTFATARAENRRAPGEVGQPLVLPSGSGPSQVAIKSNFGYCIDAFDDNLTIFTVRNQSISR